MTNNKNKDKPIYFSDYFNIDKKKLDELGAFDPILNVDTKLFIEPLLIKNNSNAIIKTSYQVFLEFFSNLLKLLKLSQYKNDKYWKQAEKLTNFGEYKDTCIGYSKGNIKGKGLSFKKTLENAKDIIDSSYNDPEMFLLLPFFEERVGADKIGDMIQHIINDSICQYTESIMLELNLKGNSKHVTRKNSYNLLLNPFDKSYIKLLPKDILAEIPIIDNIVDVFEDMTTLNHRLRETLNEEIGFVWENLTKEEKKEKLLEKLKTNTDFFADSINVFKEYEAKPYDLKSDYLGLYKWLEISKSFINFPISDELIADISNVEQLRNLLISIITNFKYSIENQYIYKMFWTKHNNRYRHVRENFSQMLFIAICYNLLCKNNNIFISKYKNIIEFKAQDDIKFVIYIKHANNPLEEIYKQSLEECKKLNLTNHIFIILNFEEKITEPLKKIRIISNPICEIFEIDVTLKDVQDDELIIFEGIEEGNKDSYYLQEKRKGGENSYQAYEPLRKKVEKLCKQELNRKNYKSARQLTTEIAKILENKHVDLLKDFLSYKKYINDGDDWKYPTFYRWCSKHYEDSKVIPLKELAIEELESLEKLEIEELELCELEELEISKVNLKLD